ncbi:MAG: HEPN domain-containing protein [Ignavibacteriaceae bacterium]|jgi:HEPN domain-containing protein
MVHKSSRIKIDKSLSANFIQVSKNFSEGAKIAFEYEYFNAAGVLIVHSAIALADALTIKLGGVKCKGENHNEILGMLKDLSPDSSQRNNALNQLESIIAHKNAVSYSGSIYDKKDIEKLLKHLERFTNWAMILFKSLNLYT